MLNIEFYPDAQDNYLYFTSDKKLFAKINTLIKDIVRGNGAEGIGKPEALKGDLSGSYSRRIDGKNRIVYRIKGDTAQIL